MFQTTLALFGISIQKQLETRSEFLFERIRALSILISLYFLWNAVFSGRTTVMGYTQVQMMTYLFLMTFLRALVLACVTDRIPSEISRGKISEILLKPLSHMKYWAVQDIANKSLHLISSSVELLIILFIIPYPLLGPVDLQGFLAFLVAVLGGMILYFQMSYALGVMGFWTAQSWGPRFCFEIVLEFCAGAFFPIDVLPLVAQKILMFTPFPYLVYYPVMLYLGKGTPTLFLQIFSAQIFWILFLGLTLKWLWHKGLKFYGAEGG
ncbi:MAG: ABC transporter permease [Elusimicrobiota bacterium]